MTNPNSDLVDVADASTGAPDLQAEAKLRQAQLDAEATLRQAEVPAAAKLLQAEVDAEATLRRAEVPAAAKLLQAEVDAEAVLRQAEIPAAAKLVQAEVDAEATLRRAEVPAAAKLLQAEVDAAATLRRAEQALDQQREAFERFFALSIDMMCMSTSDGYITRASPSFDVLGYDRDELSARPVLDLVHPDDRAATQAAYDKLAAASPTITLENRYRCKDGTYRWLSWASGRDASGVVYSMARDITEAKRSQEALIRAKDAAQSANRELESFSYSVAHDLRAPLRSIDGFSQALLEDYVAELDVTGQKYLTFIRESTRQMAQLIDDLLGLARITQGALQCEHVDLSNLARVAGTRLQASHPERSVDVRIQDGLNDEGDARLLAIVFDNLLGNAWKFTARRTDARIEFGADTDGGRLAYFVRDNGAGFDMAQVNRLFGVFQRLHAVQEFEGTGVGLATVRRIVTRHGGRVWADGELDRGAIFHFTLHEPPSAIQAEPTLQLRA